MQDSAGRDVARIRAGPAVACGRLQPRHRDGGGGGARHLADAVGRRQPAAGADGPRRLRHRYRQLDVARYLSRRSGNRLRAAGWRRSGDAHRRRPAIRQPATLLAQWLDDLLRQRPFRQREPLVRRCRRLRATRIVQPRRQFRVRLPGLVRRWSLRVRFALPILPWRHGDLAPCPGCIAPARITGNGNDALSKDLRTSALGAAAPPDGRFLYFAAKSGPIEDSAETIGRADELGGLEPGKFADLLRARPRSACRHTQHPVAVPGDEERPVLRCRHARRAPVGAASAAAALVLERGAARDGIRRLAAAASSTARGGRRPLNPRRVPPLEPQAGTAP